MIKTSRRKALHKYSNIKLQAAYLATILLPWGLVLSRGAADSCCVLTGILFLWESWEKKKWGWVYDPLVRLGLIAWLWGIAVVTPLAANIPESYSIAAPWIRYVLFYAALKYWVLTDRKSLLLLIKILALMLVLVMADTLWQYITGTSLSGHIRDNGGRLTGPMSNVKVGIFIAKLLLPISGIFLFFSLSYKKYSYMACGIFVLLSGIMTIMLSGERTAFFSNIIAICALAVFLSIVEPGFRKIVLAGIAILTASIGFIFITQHWVQVRAHEFYITISNFFVSDYGQLFRAGFIIGKENLLTGAGFKGFRELCPELIARNKVTYCNLHPHNPYIESFAEAGAVGIILFIGMVACMVHMCLKSFRQQRGIYRILPAFALACVISNFFPFMPTQSVYSNWPAILLWYCLSIALASLNIKAYNKSSVIRRPS